MDELLSSELSASTLAALRAHLQGQEEAQEHREEVAGGVSEDFRLSQFWYDDKTSMALAKESIDHSNQEDMRIAFISTPAAYRAFVQIIPEEKRKNVYLFEYDYRFQDLYGDQFVFYDYNYPTKLPAHLHHFFDYMVLEPPYLTAACIEKFAETLRWVARDVEESDSSDKKSVIRSKCAFFTARTRRQDIYDELGFTPTAFAPTFESKLSNHLVAYTNYASERYGQCTEEF